MKKETKKQIKEKVPSEIKATLFIMALENAKVEDHISRVTKFCYALLFGEVVLFISFLLLLYGNQYLIK